MLKKAEKLEILATYSATQGIKVTAGIVQDNLSDMFRKRIVERKDSSFLYFIARAVTADVPNKNHDLFPLDEIKEHYMTFVDRCLFLDHNAKKVENAVGKVVAAELRTDDSGETYVACLCRVDRWLQPHICRMIEAGTINSVSMGANVGWAECSQCGCKATKESEFCEHMKAPNLYNSHSINHDVEFTELSLVSVPADPSAKMSKVFDLHHDLTKTADAVQGKDPMAQAQNPAISPEQEQVTPQEETVVDFGDDVQNPLYQIDCSSNEAADHIFNVLHAGLNKGIEELTIAGKTIKLKIEPDIEDHFEFLRGLLANADMFFGKGTMTEDDVLAIQSAVSPLLQKLASKPKHGTPHSEFNLTIDGAPVKIILNKHPGSGSGARKDSKVLDFKIEDKGKYQKAERAKKIKEVLTKAVAPFFDITTTAAAPKNYDIYPAAFKEEGPYRAIRDDAKTYDSVLSQLLSELLPALKSAFSEAGWLGGKPADKQEEQENTSDTKELDTLYAQYSEACEASDWEKGEDLKLKIKDKYAQATPEQQKSFRDSLIGIEDDNTKELVSELPEPAEQTKEVETSKETKPEEQKQETKPAADQKTSEDIHDNANKAYDDLTDKDIPGVPKKFQDAVKKLCNRLASSSDRAANNKIIFNTYGIKNDVNNAELAKFIYQKYLISLGKPEEAESITVYDDYVKNNVNNNAVDAFRTLHHSVIGYPKDVNPSDEKAADPDTSNKTEVPNDKQPGDQKQAPNQEQQKEQQTNQNEEFIPEEDAEDAAASSEQPSVAAQKPTFTAEGLVFTLYGVDGVAAAEKQAPKAKPLYTKTTRKDGSVYFSIGKAYRPNIIKMLADSNSYNVDLGMGENVPFSPAEQDKPITFLFKITDDKQHVNYSLDVKYVPGQPFTFTLTNWMKADAMRALGVPEAKVKEIVGNAAAEWKNAKRQSEEMQAESFRAVIHQSVYYIYKQLNQADETKAASADLLTAITKAKLQPQFPNMSQAEGEIPCTLTILDKTFNDSALTLTYKVTDPKEKKVDITFKDPSSGSEDTRTYVFANGKSPEMLTRDLYDHYLNIGKYIITLYFKEKDNGNKADGTK